LTVETPHFTQMRSKRGWENSIAFGPNIVSVIGQMMLLVNHHPIKHTLVFDDGRKNASVNETIEIM
jgi:hypothetical protein